MTQISIATWNLHQAVDKRPENITATWRYLEEEVSPTVALVQEAVGKSIPKSAGRNVYWPAGEVLYETAVVAYAGRLEFLPNVTTRWRQTTFAIRPTVPATLAVARVVDVPNVEPFVAISLYGRMARCTPRQESFALSPILSHFSTHPSLTGESSAAVTSTSMTRRRTM